MLFIEYKLACWIILFVPVTKYKGKCKNFIIIQIFMESSAQNHKQAKIKKRENLLCLTLFKLRFDVINL